MGVGIPDINIKVLIEYLLLNLYGLKLVGENIFQENYKIWKLTGGKDMRKFLINVNGNEYEVEVEEIVDGKTQTRPSTQK